jgi:hypothetical protein
MILNNVRIGRLWLTKPFQPRPDKNGKIGEAKYKAELIVPMTHPQLPEIKAMQKAAALKKWGTDAQQKLLIAETQDKLPLHRGDVTRAGDAAYAGALYLTANNKEQPTVVVTDPGTNVNIATRGTAIVLAPSHANWPYSGSYVNVHLDFFAYQNDGTGISCNLLGMQFLRHGTRLQGALVSAASEFGLVPADADGAAPEAPAAGSAGLV